MRALSSLLLSFIVFSSSAWGDLCQSQYLRYHFDDIATDAKVNAAKALEDLYRRSQDATDLRAKLDLIEERTDVFGNTLRAKFAKLEADAKEAGLVDEELKAFIAKGRIESFFEMREYSNRMVDEAAELFREKGIPVEVKQTWFDDYVPYKYLRLESGQTNSAAVKKIEKLKERFGTETVTFDIVQNAILGSAGFSVAEKRWIDLGVRGMRNLLLDDVITMVGKHEFYHAAFGAKRQKNVSSIYHTSYFATGEKNLSEAGKAYERFMSAEEVYNWANNSHWAATRLRKISQYESKDYLYDLQMIRGYLDGSKNLAAQTEEIVENTLDGLKAMRKEIEEGSFNLILLNESNAMAKSADEAFMAVWRNPNHEVLIKEFMGPEYRAEIKAIMKNRNEIAAKLTQESLDSGKKLSKQEMVDRLFKMENKQSGEHILSMFETFERKQRALGKVATAMKKESEAVIQKTDDFMDKLKKALERDPKALKDPRWEDEFKDLAAEYRKFGNLVKEDYKGFAGK